MDRTQEAKAHHRTERRRILLTIRLTDLEAEMLSAAASRADLGVSELVRARIFGGADLDGRVARLERRLEALAPRRRRPGRSA